MKRIYKKKCSLLFPFPMEIIHSSAIHLQINRLVDKNVFEVEMDIGQ